MDRAERRDLYRLLGGLVQRCPSEALLTTVSSTGTLARLASRAREGAVRDALRWMASDLARGPGSFAEIRADYEALLVGPERPLAPPWESAYRSATDAPTSVRRAYAARGIVFEEMTERAADHAGFELEFVSILLAQGTCGRTARRARREFLSEHVLVWMPAWAADVCVHSRGVFMHGLAEVVAGLCAAEQARLSKPRRSARKPVRMVAAA